MKTYTPTERAEAKRKLPRQVSDFLSSDAITDIYVGLMQKHRINIRQGALMSEIANLTLLGLEPESALETNLHQAIPELSADTMRELVADINDRVFKEARRRLQEDITAPEAEWDEVEFGPKPKAGEELPQVLSDEELDKLAEKEEKEGWKPPEEEQEIESAPQNRPTILEGKEAQIQATAPVSIALGKLNAPTAVKPQQVTVAPQETGIQQISATRPTPTAQSPASATKIYPSGNDPYRESVE